MGVDGKQCEQIGEFWRQIRPSDTCYTQSTMNQSRVGYTGLCTRLRLGEGSKVDLGEAGYLKERLIPQPGDVLYLHLSDLLIALKALIPTHVSMVLDYGCGGTPHQPPLPRSAHHRAPHPPRHTHT